MRIQFINKNRIIMMDIRLNHLIDIITKKERLVVKVDFYIHSNNKDNGFWILGIYSSWFTIGTSNQYPASRIPLFLIFAA